MVQHSEGRRDSRIMLLVLSDLPSGRFMLLLLCLETAHKLVHDHVKVYDSN